jgi:hypothetical protein
LKNGSGFGEMPDPFNKNRKFIPLPKNFRFYRLAQTMGVFVKIEFKWSKQNLQRKQEAVASCFCFWRMSRTAGRIP